jgi:hypothetical protein
VEADAEARAAALNDKQRLVGSVEERVGAGLERSLQGAWHCAATLNSDLTFSG